MLKFKWDFDQAESFLIALIFKMVVEDFFKTLSQQYIKSIPRIKCSYWNSKRNKNISQNHNTFERKSYDFWLYLHTFYFLFL